MAQSGHGASLLRCPLVTRSGHSFSSRLCSEFWLSCYLESLADRSATRGVTRNLLCTIALIAGVNTGTRLRSNEFGDVPGLGPRRLSNNDHRGALMITFGVRRGDL